MTDWRDDRFDRLEAKVDMVLERTASIDPLRQTLETHIQRDDKILNGNGEPGLIRQVDRILQWQSWQKWLFGLVIAAAFASWAEVAREALFR